MINTQKHKTMKTYKIGTYKAGQQIANEVYESNDLNSVKTEFIRMFNATEFAPEDNAPETAEEAWSYKHFAEDTNNVAVFEVEDGEALHTNYTYQGCESTML